MLREFVRGLHDRHPTTRQALKHLTPFATFFAGLLVSLIRGSSLHPGVTLFLYIAIGIFVLAYAVIIIGFTGYEEAIKTKVATLTKSIEDLTDNLYELDQDIDHKVHLVSQIREIVNRKAQGRTTVNRG